VSQFLKEYFDAQYNRYGKLSQEERNVIIHSAIADYQRTGRVSHLETVLDVLAHALYLMPIKQPAKCYGYDIDELLGEAYTVVLGAAKDYNPKYGVPFAAFFWIRLKGHLAYSRRRERKYVYMDDMTVDFNAKAIVDAEEASDFIESDVLDAWLAQLTDESEETRLIRAYIILWKHDKDPRGFNLSHLSGIKLEDMGVVIERLPTRIASLIL